MNRNARKFRAKPLVVAIAATLCLEVAAGAWAGDPANGGASGMNAAPSAQVDPQSDQSTTTTTATKPKRVSNKEKEAQTLQAITVTGIAGSQERDLVLKRYAPQIQDSITAVNIGQLPDVTITDALSRVPGVQIGRSGGEGSTISVNGLPEVAQTLNGEQFVSPGGDSGVFGAAGNGVPDLASNQPDFIDIPPTLFSGVDVIKSLTASNIAGGVSGIVNLRTHRPFDFKPGWTLNGSVTGDWGDRTQKLNKSGSFLASYHNDRWGALLTGSYSEENITNDAPTLALFGSTVADAAKVTEQDVGFNFGGAGGPLGNSTAKGSNDFYYNWDYKSFDRTDTNRKRAGLDGAFQYKISDALTLIAEGMYTKMKETDYRYSVLLQSAQGLQPGPVAPVVSNGNVISGYNIYSQIAGQTLLAHGPTASLNTNLELKFDNGGLFSGDLRWVHGRAHKVYNFAGADMYPNQGNDITLPDGTETFDNPDGLPNALPAYLNLMGEYPQVHITPDLSNFSNWALVSSYAAADRIDTKMNVYRGDGTLHFDDGILDSFDFGARYEKQNYVFNYFYYLTPLDPNGSCADPLGPGPLDAWNRYLDPRSGLVCDNYSINGNNGSIAAPMQVTNMPAGWLTAFNGFSPMTITSGPNGSTVFPALSKQALENPVQYLETRAGTFLSGTPTAFQDPTQSWMVNERIKSFYGQFNLSGELGSLPWNSNIGIRRVDTNIQVINYQTNSSDFIGNSGSWNGVLINQGAKVFNNNYDSWLPAFNFALNVTDDQILRLAWNKTQAQQSLSDLGRGSSVFYEVNGNPPVDPTLPQNAQIFVNAVAGNPDLKPYASKNINLSYGWYFNPQSLLYVGAFFMNVSSFPISETIQERLPDADGVVRRAGPVQTIVNGSGAIIRGLQGEYRTQFTQLPGWLGGFGLNLNYTYLRSSQNGAAGASHTYNAIVFYQKDKVQARLAYNWQGKSFALSNSATGDVLNVYNSPQGYLDASFQYDLTKQLSVIAQATNLTDTHDRQYIEGTRYWWSDNISERRYYAGLRFTF
ncbi:MAG TPA: TonB-dependent receptor [Rhodanobacteraceae bacterium]|nr:TonB-dependent receptor [Rhodanobacteraceae bacterium]